MKRITLALAVLLFATIGCEKKDIDTIEIDGSSTVYPITEAAAEEFSAFLREQGRAGEVRVTIGVSGTGGGFEKFCRGDTDITGASRPIKPVEVEACREAGIEFIELPIAYDGITVVTHPDNDWVDQMTIAELEKIWEPDAQQNVTRWNDVRDEWPDRPLSLYGAGIDSGTYDYFTKAVAGEEGESRGDFTSSEDDNVLVQGVSGDVNALGFFGFAYFDENRDKLNAVPISYEGGEPISPSLETISNNTYQPLARPLFIYVKKASAERQAVKDFITFYLTDGQELSAEVGYIPMPERAYELALERFENRKVGSVFGGAGSTVGVSVQDLLTREGDEGSEDAEPAEDTADDDSPADDASSAEPETAEEEGSQDDAGAEEEGSAEDTSANEEEGSDQEEAEESSE
jgi:phosphate transport system substrate-binding protein